jgi:hypothetical protein
MDEGIAVPLAGMTMVIVIVLGIPLVRGLVKRWEREPVALPESRETAQRLARIEQAIDAMSIEVERIAEGQRFVTKVLGDRAAADRAAISSGPERHA